MEFFSNFSARKFRLILDKSMRFSPEKRRELGLFNVAEASRELGIGLQKFYYMLRAERVPAPTFAIGARMYYRSSEIDELKKKMKEQE